MTAILIILILVLLAVVVFQWKTKNKNDETPVKGDGHSLQYSRLQQELQSKSEQMLQKDIQISRLERDIHELSEEVRSCKAVITRHNDRNMPIIKSLMASCGEQIFEYETYADKYAGKNPLVTQAEAFKTRYAFLNEDESIKELIQKLSFSFEQFDFVHLRSLFENYTAQLNSELTYPLSINAQLFQLSVPDTSGISATPVLQHFYEEEISPIENAYTLLSGEYFERYRKIINPSIGKKIGDFLKKTLNDVSSLTSQPMLEGSGGSPMDKLSKLPSYGDKEFISKYTEVIDLFANDMVNRFNEKLRERINTVFIAYRKQYLLQNTQILQKMNNDSLEGKDIEPMSDLWHRSRKHILSE